jgi:death on curing protein
VTFYLERDEVVLGGFIACGFPLIVADEGLLQAAVARPRASVFGDDAYPTLWDKAAALLHSLGAQPCIRRRQQTDRVGVGVGIPAA